MNRRGWRAFVVKNVLKYCENLVAFFGVFVAAFCALGDESPECVGLTRVEMNNPDADVHLAVGLWSWVVPADADGDGLVDLVVSCEDVPYNGVWFFKNLGDDPINPTFDKAKRLSKGVINVQPSWVDGRLRVLTPGQEYPDFLQTGVANPIPLLNGGNPLPTNVHFNRVRGNMWRIVDYDGDGINDLIVGSDDWTDYGWDDAYDANGVWQNGPLRGNLYLLRNVGTNAAPVYESPTMLKDVDGANLETFGWPSPNFADWDGDGDLDIVGGEFRDTLQYSENVGTRAEPRYKPFEPLTLVDGSPAAAELAMPTFVAYDWNLDGKLDVFIGDEDGRVGLFLNTGALRDGKPVFDPPFYFKQRPDALKCGALATPWGVDWDDDGDWDLLCGNSAGYIFFIENLSGSGVDPPKWAAPVALCSEPDDATLAETQKVVPEGSSLVERRRDGSVPIRIMAGPNGSIQGPCEPKWGYTTLSVADWDGDGLKDVLVNSILGNVFWYKNVGEKGKPKLGQPRPVEVEWEGEPEKLAWGWRFPKGKELLTQWRTTPVAIDFNCDGLVDLAILDATGRLAFFERRRGADGDLKLMAPKHTFVDASGRPLQLTVGRAGASGRRKLCFVDYNNDGKLDFLANGKNAELYFQTGERDGAYCFVRMGEIDPLPIKGHSTSPTVVDFDNDGVMDPLIGAEDGHFYYKHNDWRQGQMGAVCFDSEQMTIEAPTPRGVLDNGAKAYSNRDYVWLDVAPELSGREFLMTAGGEPVDIVVKAKTDVELELLVCTTAPLDKSADVLFEEEDFETSLELAARYSDAGKSAMTLFKKKLRAGQTWAIPVQTWSGTIVLLPKD